MGNVIAVTGATGHVGQELTQRLLSRGHTVRAIARTADKLASLRARGADVRPGSLADRRFLEGVFRGASGVFAMIPPFTTSQDLRADQKKTAESIVAAIRESGVKYVVSLSSMGAELPEMTGPIVGLHVFEERLDKVPGLNVVHLRAAYFMENHLGSIGLVKSAGVNGSLIKPESPFPMIATRDIAERAAGFLDKLDFQGRTVRYLLGPRDYTMTEATRILGASIGKPDLKYVEFPEADFRNGLSAAGFSANVAELFVEMLRGLSGGFIKGEPRTTANTTLTTLEEFAKATFAPAFKASPIPAPLGSR
jgi:uncharacterized protein YbjT (DUF2867 family)